jgi:ribosomal protein L12E/L44/L45/RPP1/RPP2
MKILTVAAVALAVAAAPAYAQMRRPPGGDKKTEEKKPKVDEKAYNEALKRIPEPKEKYDPWSGARPDNKSK